MNCRNCGAPMADGELFCGSCGTKAEKKYIYCINCGEKLEAGTQYCENCGADLMQRFNEDEPVKGESNVKKGLMIAIIAVLVLVIIGCGVLVWDILSKPGNDIEPVQTEMPISTPAGDVTQYYSDGQPLPTAPPPRPQTGYLFNSDTEYITQSYLDTKTKDEVRLILNEIYAKNGYIFSMEEFRNYFMAKPWYTPITTSAQEAESRFNSIERANKETITKYEQSMGWR